MKKLKKYHIKITFGKNLTNFKSHYADDNCIDIGRVNVTVHAFLLLSGFLKITAGNLH